MALSGLAILVVLLITIHDSLNPAGELIGIPRAIPPYVRAGESVDIQWGEYVKHRDCPGFISRTLEDGSRVTLSPSVTTTSPGSYDSFKTTLTIPPYLPPGEWYYRVSIQFRCLPWTWHTVDFPPVQVTVMP